jgi:hypothetical protein
MPANDDFDVFFQAAYDKDFRGNKAKNYVALRGICSEGEMHVFALFRQYDEAKVQIMHRIYYGRMEAGQFVDRRDGPIWRWDARDHINVDDGD